MCLCGKCLTGLQQRKNDVNNPLLVRKMCVKRLCCLRQKTTSTTNKKSKLNSAVQKRRSSTPPFLLMLFYKPFCRVNICKTDVFDFFINQRFERNFLPFAVNQRLKNWRFRRWLQINILEIGVFAVFRACSNVIFMANIFCWGFVFQNLQRRGFSIQIWQSHSVATSVSGLFEFMANQRLKIYVFAVFRVCGNAIFMANIFLPVVLSFETCSLACLQCNFCVKVVFLR